MSFLEQSHNHRCLTALNVEIAHTFNVATGNNGTKLIHAMRDYFP